MRRFRFRLAPLLRLRSQFERQARAELATAMTAVHGIEQRAAAAALAVREFAEQGVRSDAIGQLAKGFESGLRRHQWRLQQQLKQAQQRLEVVRVDYTQKAKDLRSLQKLREQQQTAWQQLRQRTEQAEIEELAALARASAEEQR
jgi:flagellar export protein FliJ